RSPSCNSRATQYLGGAAPDRDRRLFRSGPKGGKQGEGQWPPPVCRFRRSCFFIPPIPMTEKRFFLGLQVYLQTRQITLGAPPAPRYSPKSYLLSPLRLPAPTCSTPHQLGAVLAYLTTLLPSADLQQRMRLRSHRRCLAQSTR